MEWQPNELRIDAAEGNKSMKVDKVSPHLSWLIKVVFGKYPTIPTPTIKVWI
jgi:hypothetical protein